MVHVKTPPKKSPPKPKPRPAPAVKSKSLPLAKPSSKPAVESKVNSRPRDHSGLPPSREARASNGDRLTLSSGATVFENSVDKGRRVVMVQDKNGKGKPRTATVEEANEFNMRFRAMKLNGFTFVRQVFEYERSNKRGIKIIKILPNGHEADPTPRELGAFANWAQYKK
ncbi:MAG: hypothetical protein NUV57_02205 [archaeon]|nr:hypothetical protein [archaeon]